jgi:hypothetical protein
MEMVKLKNGSEVATPLVAVVTVSLVGLQSLGLQGMLAIYDLREIIRDPKYKSNFIDLLKQYQLIDANGNIHSEIKNIVLSAVQGEMLEMQLVDPRA